MSVHRQKSYNRYFMALLASCVYHAGQRTSTKNRITLTLPASRTRSYYSKSQVQTSYNMRKFTQNIRLLSRTVWIQAGTRALLVYRDALIYLVQSIRVTKVNTEITDTEKKISLMVKCSWTNT